MDHFEFATSLTFEGLTREQRAAKCRAMAAEAQILAATSEAQMRHKYVDLAKKWSDLADQIERVVTARHPWAT